MALGDFGFDVGVIVSGCVTNVCSEGESYQGNKKFRSHMVLKGEGFLFWS